jgi:hypothetical protein
MGTTPIRVAFLLLLVSTAACGGTSTAPSNPPVLNLAGTWSGTVRVPGSQGGPSITVTWVATQVGNTVSGPETVVNPRRATYTGTLAETIKESDLSITESVPQGNIPFFASCSISGAGTLSTGTNAISGTVTSKYTSCEGFNSFPNPDAVTEEFALTK